MKLLNSLSVLFSLLFILPHSRGASTYPIVVEVSATNLASWPNIMFTDTGVHVTNGDLVTVSAEGAWYWGGGFYVGPDGQNDGANGQYLKPYHGQLIGYIGSISSLPTTFIGIGAYNSFTSTATGNLILGFNDDNSADPPVDVNDNRGSVFAEITLGSPAPPPPNCIHKPTLGPLSYVAGDGFSFTCAGPAGPWTLSYSDDGVFYNTLTTITIPNVSPNISYVTYKDTTITSLVTNRSYRLSSGTCCSQPLGFTRLHVAPGQSLFFANQYWFYPNTLQTIFITQHYDTATLADNIQISKWNGSSWTNYNYASGAWSPSTGNSATLKPGEGAFIQNNGLQPTDFLIIGWVRENTIKNVVSAGENAISSTIPRAGLLHVLSFPTPSFGDTVYKYNGTGYNSYTYFGSWAPSEPAFGIGEGFFYDAGAVLNWNFSYTACGR